MDKLYKPKIKTTPFILFALAIILMTVLGVHLGGKVEVNWPSVDFITPALNLSIIAVLSFVLWSCYTSASKIVKNMQNTTLDQANMDATAFMGVCVVCYLLFITSLLWATDAHFFGLMLFSDFCLVLLTSLLLWVKSHELAYQDKLCKAANIENSPTENKMLFFIKQIAFVILPISAIITTVSSYYKEMTSDASVAYSELIYTSLGSIDFACDNQPKGCSVSTKHNFIKNMLEKGQEIAQADPSYGTISSLKYTLPDTNFIATVQLKIDKPLLQYDKVGVFQLTLWDTSKTQGYPYVSKPFLVKNTLSAK